MFREGIQHVRKFFGLEVQVLSIDRGPGVAAAAEGVMKRRTIRAGIKDSAELRQRNQKTLQELMEKENELVIGGTGSTEDLEELKFTRREIKRLRGALAPLEQTASSLMAQPSGATDSPSRIDEIALLAEASQGDPSDGEAPITWDAEIDELSAGVSTDDPERGS